MSVGLALYDLPAREALELAEAADAFGFDALWLAEHVVTVEHDSPHPLADGPRASALHSGTELLDPWVTLGAMAAATERIKVATGIHLVALRHPLTTARHSVTLHDVSDGRFMLGTGAGWIAEEFAALQVPFDRRGARVDEALDILRLAWTGEWFAYQGAHFQVPRVKVHPRPVTIPLIVGGNSPAALRRAARIGDGWFSSGFPTVDEALRLRDTLASLRAQHGRTDPFTFYLRIGKADPGLVARYAAEGLHDIVVQVDRDRIWPRGTLDDRRAALRSVAQDLGLIP
ncbi:TIGR03619 family F420-dependent LLM class oxidoreductase [Streptomyces sp. NPDC004726]